MPKNSAGEATQKIDANAAVETVMVFDTRLNDGDLDRKLCFQALGVAGPSWEKTTRDLNSEAAEAWLVTHFKQMNEAPNPAPQGKPFVTASVGFITEMPKEIAQELCQRIALVAKSNGVGISIMSLKAPIDSEDRSKGRVQVYHFFPGRANA